MSNYVIQHMTHGSEEASDEHQFVHTQRPPNCHYCGRFIGKNDNVEVETIYGHLSPDHTLVYHKKCKSEPCQNCGVPGNHDNGMCSKCWNEL